MSALPINLSHSSLPFLPLLLIQTGLSWAIRVSLSQRSCSTTLVSTRFNLRTLPVLGRGPVTWGSCSGGETGRNINTLVSHSQVSSHVIIMCIATNLVDQNFCKLHLQNLKEYILTCLFFSFRSSSLCGCPHCYQWEQDENLQTFNDL